jgi:hypothetical protein
MLSREGYAENLYGKTILPGEETDLKKGGHNDMPTYKNTSGREMSSVAALGTVRFPPGEEVEVECFLPAGEIEWLEEVRSEPPVRSGIQKAELTDNKDDQLELEYRFRGELSFVARDGEAKVWLADDDDPITLPEGGSWSDVCYWGKVKRVGVEGSVSLTWKEV